MSHLGIHLSEINTYDHIVYFYDTILRILYIITKNLEKQQNR